MAEAPPPAADAAPPPPPPGDADALAAAVARGERTALARAITLLESRRPDRAALGEAVLARLLPRSGGAVRVGVTGVPGVGKSTFLDALGSHLTARGRKVAVLAVDPSSERHGGSILGDKTRMARLAADANAYVRPSPAGGVLGGVAAATREALHLCEAAGFDVAFVETVGVGQSETAVARMVDTFLVLALPGAGDELQGIKKGIVELADVVAVTKSDGPNALAAAQAARHWEAALHIVAPPQARDGPGPAWRVPVLEVSAVEGRGIAEAWDAIRAHRRALEAAGALAAKRRAQALGWFRALLDAELRAALLRPPELAEAVRSAEAGVAAGAELPLPAARRVGRLLRRRLAGGSGGPAA